jgi:hypothetical protein
VYLTINKNNTETPVAGNDISAKILNASKILFPDDSETIVDPVLSTGVKLFHRNPMYQNNVTYTMDVPRGQYLVVAAVGDSMFGTEHDLYVNGKELVPQSLKAMRRDKADRRNASKSKLKRVELIPPDLDLSKPCLKKDEVKKIAVGPQKWSCKACTFLNGPTATACVICTAKRPQDDGSSSSSKSANPFQASPKSGVFRFLGTSGGKFSLCHLSYFLLYFLSLYPHSHIHIHTHTHKGTNIFRNPAYAGAIDITSQCQKLVQAPHFEYNICDGMDTGTYYTNSQVQMKKSNLQIKLEDSRRLRPTGYALRIGTNIAPRNWDFQASKNGKEWKTLSMHRDDPTIPTNVGGAGYWRVGDPKSPPIFRGPPIVDAYLTRTGPFGDTVRNVSKMFPKVSLRTIETCLSRVGLTANGCIAPYVRECLFSRRSKTVLGFTVNNNLIISGCSQHELIRNNQRITHVAEDASCVDMSTGCTVRLRTSSSEDKSLRQWNGKRGIVRKIYERGDDKDDDATGDGSSKKDDDTWTCGVCTLLNSNDVTSCSVCMSPRPAPKNLFASKKKIEYKWQFEDGQAKSGEWRDYTSQDSVSLEKAFAAKSPTTQITNRWGTYDITFVFTKTADSAFGSGTQKSKKNSFVRPIRRVTKFGSLAFPPDVDVAAVDVEIYREDGKTRMLLKGTCVFGSFLVFSLFFFSHSLYTHTHTHVLIISCTRGNRGNRGEA